MKKENWRRIFRQPENQFLKMDWGRELCEESSAFGPENKSWRV